MISTFYRVLWYKFNFFVIYMESDLSKTVKLQQIASNPRHSAWVFASAGSGKTKVLTDRVLRLLLDDVLPHKILCLTFTKTAAAEMQERINARLAELVILNDAKLVQNLSVLTGNFASETLLKKARILFAQILDADSQIKVQTIHSFCQNLVKIFPFEIGVKPNFEVMDDNLEKLFLQKAKKEVFSESLKNKALRDVIVKINGKLNEESFIELVGKILSQKERLIFLKNELFDIENIIDEIFKVFAVSRNESEEEIFQKFDSKIRAEEILQLAQSLENSKMKTDQKTAVSLKFFLQNISLQNFSSYRKIFFTKDDSKRKISSIVTKEFVENAEFITAQQDLILDFTEHLNSYKTAQSTSLLLRLIDHILEKYQELKNKSSFLDYNDLIIKTDKMLHNHESSDWIKFRMDGFFDHILIDESQDTNHRQWNIIKALTEDFFAGESAQNKNRTIFIIGDDKQSIYSFQGSEPNISHDIFSYYQQKLSGSSFKLHKIDLVNSFRSLPKILQAVDAIFLSKNYMGSLDYQAHKAIRNGEGKVEILPHVKKEKITAEKSFNWQEISKNLDDEEFCEKESLAENIALKIKSWIKEGRMLEAENRPINYGDIMILMRNRTNGFDKILQKKFQENSIPFASTKKTNFADELIIQDLFAAARFGLLPYDDLNLAALLKSPFFSFDEEKLFKISVIKNQNKISLFDALKLDSSSVRAVLQLEELIIKSRQLNCFEFFSFLITEDLRQAFINEFGSDASPIVDQFISQLFDFYKNTSPNLQKFLDFAEKLNPRIAINRAENNQIIITTIHSAKGLQAPIVIIPDCCFNFNQMPFSKENFFWIDSKVNGKNQQLPIWCARKSEENSLVKLYKAEKIKEAKQEYSRLLYVAMTRAKDELYLAGFGANAPDSWYEIARDAINGKM